MTPEPLSLGPNTARQCFVGEVRQGSPLNLALAGRQEQEGEPLRLRFEDESGGKDFADGVRKLRRETRGGCQDGTRDGGDDDDNDDLQF